MTPSGTANGVCKQKQFVGDCEAWDDGNIACGREYSLFSLFCVVLFAVSLFVQLVVDCLFAV